MKQAIWATAFLLIGGCGAWPVIAPADCLDNVDCLDDAVASDGGVSNAPDSPVVQPPSASPTPQVTPRQDPGVIDIPVSSLLLLDPLFFLFPGSDPFAFSIFGPTDSPELFSLLADMLVLDLLSPAPSRDTFTFLELLCIDTGRPEFLCRQRYGN